MIDIENARALVETLKDYAEHPSSFTDISPTEADAAADLIDALIAEVRDREDVLERAGFRRCDISACNCGSWHQVGGFKARFDEIKEAIAEHVDLNGKTLLTAVQEVLTDERARRVKAERAIREAVLAEREACASLIEPKNPRSDWTEYAEAKADCAAMIRARGAA
jgi:hypothetical protein